MARLRILVTSKITTEIPIEYGVFGAQDCMGAVRDREFDAVMMWGIGARSKFGIAGKINSIGIGPHKFIHRVSNGDGKLDHFLDSGTGGKTLESLALCLPSGCTQTNVRAVIDNLSEDEYRGRRNPPSS